MGGKKVSKHLLDMGYSKFAFVGFENDEKERGFKEEIVKAGFNLDNKYVFINKLKNNSVASDLKEFILNNLNDEGIGIFTHNDIEALMVLHVLKELRVKIPEQVALVGFDNTYITKEVSPSISSVAQSIEEIGRKAVEILMDKIKLLHLMHIAEKLKDETRHSYTSKGRHESVAEHCWRASLLAYFIKDEFKDADINKVIIDVENSTVYLEDPKMSLDVGSVAKGFATEIAAEEIEAAGLKSGIISAGGNVRVIGKPLDGVRDRWGIGIQDPSKAVISDEDNTLDIVFLNNESVVSSGDYERFYVVDGKKYHHIIDPETLMPGTYYKQVTIVTQHSGAADMLSTGVFLLPFEESRKLVESLDGVEALWVMPDGKIEATDGLKKMLHSLGASSTDKK
jgi:hypothetical protein